MPQPFQDILIVSDLDGTLIADDSKIPERNFAAIERFKAGGGKFAIATGRSMESGRNYISPAKPNAPCVLLNGAMLYDYEQKKIIWDHPLPSSSAEYLRRVLECFPEVGIEVFSERSIYVIKDTPGVRRHIKWESLTARESKLEEIENRCYKSLLVMNPEWMEEVQSFVESFPHEGVRFVSSSPIFLEMLPAGVDKSVAFSKLLQILKIPRGNSYAVGDYYNDLELLSAAGTGAVPENAPREVKEKASLLLCHCRDGAVADLIERIEAKRV